MESRRRRAGEAMTARLWSARVALIGLSVMLGLSLAPAYAQQAGLSDNNGTVSTPAAGGMQYGELITPYGSLVGVGNNAGSGSGPGNGSTGTGQTVGCQDHIDISGYMQIPGLGIGTDPPVAPVSTDTPSMTPTPTSNDIQDPHTSQAGLVGMPTWLWNPYYDGQEINSKTFTGWHITCTNDQPNPPIQITLVMHAWPISYHWKFGDGGEQQGQCGQEKVEGTCPQNALGQPNTGDLQHTYEVSSPDTVGYHITLHVEFGVDISIDGGTPQFLPKIPEDADLYVPVREVQSVLVPVPTP